LRREQGSVVIVEDSVQDENASLEQRKPGPFCEDWSLFILSHATSVREDWPDRCAALPSADLPTAAAAGLPSLRPVLRWHDHRVWPGIHQTSVTVLEPHDVRRFPLVPVYLNDLAVPVRVPDDVAVDADFVSYDRFHAAISRHVEGVL
jgi:hypothetical protein